MDFQIERQLNAPIDQVWDAWTQAKQLQKWYSPGPINWTVTELDVRPGGAYAMHMETPDGKHIAEGTFREVHAPTRLVQAPLDESTVIQTHLESIDDGTHMTVIMEGLPEAQHDMMHGAWTAGFDKLDALLASNEA